VNGFLRFTATPVLQRIKHMASGGGNNTVLMIYDCVGITSVRNLGGLHGERGNLGGVSSSVQVSSVTSRSSEFGQNGWFNLRGLRSIYPKLCPKEIMISTNFIMHGNLPTTPD